jgi:tripartite-type tricarboxylate transporter receptor subunit TctC
MREALASPEAQKTLTEMRMYPAPTSPEEYDDILAREATKLRPLAVELGLKLN